MGRNKKRIVAPQVDKMVRGPEQSGLPEPVVKQEQSKALAPGQSSQGTVRVRVLCNWVYGIRRFKAGQEVDLPETDFERFRNQLIFEEIK